MVLATAAVLALAAIPLTNASHLGTGAADVRFDASQWSSAFVGDQYVGEQSVNTYGGNLSRATAYELTFTHILPPNNTTTVELRNATGAVVVPGTPLSTGPQGPGGALRNATFLVSTSSFQATGLYTLHPAGGHPALLGAVLAGPTRDIIVTTSPTTIPYNANSSMVLSIHSGVAGASVTGAHVPPNATTDANGDYTFVAQMPAPGTYSVEVAKDLGGSALPERTGTATYSVVTAEGGLYQHDLVSPSNGQVGQPVTVSVDVTNAGGSTSSGTVLLLVNDAQRDAQSVTLASGESSTLSFTFTPTVAGNYSIATRLGNTTLGPRTLVVSGAPCSCLMVNATPDTISQNAWASVNVSVRDQFGNPVVNADVRLLRTDGQGTPADGSDFQGTTFVSGTGAPGAGANGIYSFGLRALHGGEFQFYATQGSSFGSDLLFVQAQPSGPAVDFKIGSVRASAFIPATTPIVMTNGSAFGAATLTLTFDPSVVAIVGVQNGTIPDATTTWNVNGSTLTILVTRNVTSAVPPGAQDFARVTLRAVGPVGSTSALDLEVVEAVDVNGGDLNAYAWDGAFRSGILGDADGDGDVDASDAQAIADAVVGKRSMASLALSNADVNGDGRVTGRDSMMVSQFVAGTRSGF